MTRYTNLDSEKIISTVEKLSRRIYERFPQSGLYQVSQQLLETAQQSKERADSISRPIIWMRALTVTLIMMIGLVIVGTVSNVEVSSSGLNLFDLIQVLEAGINDIIFLGAGIFFLWTAEARVRRSRVLKALHELRSIAHVIDMHQLTKDPERSMFRGIATPSSPVNNLSPFELTRYLDYCSEMLSLVGKLAALYVQQFDDSVVIAAVNEIEDLTTGLSRKIWQKVMIISSNRAENAR